MILFRFGLIGIAAVLLSSCTMGHKIEVSPSALAAQNYDEQHLLFTIKGCVHHPGRFTLKTGQTMTLGEALRKAGGTIDGNYFAGERSADLVDIRVRRLQGGSVVEFKLAVYPGQADQNFLIQPGDLILVPELV